MNKAMPKCKFIFSWEFVVFMLLSEVTVRTIAVVSIYLTKLNSSKSERAQEKTILL